MIRLPFAAVAALLVAVPAAAQTVPVAVPQAAQTTNISTLSIEDATSLALRNNPNYRQTLNNRRGAEAAVRSAYAAFLPTANVSMSFQQQQGGTQVFNGGTFGASSDVQQSQYNLGLQYRLNATTLLMPRYEKALRTAVEADIDNSAFGLRVNVSTAYLNALKADAQASLQDSLVGTAMAQVELAKTRASVGMGTQLDVTRAEVTLGQQRVQAVRAHNTAQQQRLELFRMMGVLVPTSVRLSSAFEIREPNMTVDEMVATASQRNPSVLASRARENASTVNLRRARSEYTPSLTISTGFSGYTYQYTDPDYPVALAESGVLRQRGSCFLTDSLRRGAGLTGMDCSGFEFTPQMASQIRAQNSQYPFDFTKSPRSLTATISLPLFDGLNREQRVQEAAASREDARYAVRERELAVAIGVREAYASLRATLETVRLQEQNAAKSKEELSLAQERYKVGSSTFLDVQQARDNYERAENERITAIYDYHIAYALLENAVGRPIR